jgi:hypothetical protein
MISMSSERPVILPMRRKERAVGGEQAGQVAGAVADDREGFLGQRGEHQFALFAVGQHFAGFRVDDLGIEMVFPDHRAILGLDAFAGDARAHHFGQAVDVDGVDAELALDLGCACPRPTARRRRCRP